MARFSLSAPEKQTLDNALNASTSSKELIVNLLNLPMFNNVSPGVKGSFIMVLDYYYSQDLNSQAKENIVDALVEFIVSNDYVAWDCLADKALVTKIKALANDPANDTDEKLHEKWLTELKSTGGPGTKIPPGPR